MKTHEEQQITTWFEKVDDWYTEGVSPQGTLERYPTAQIIKAVEYVREKAITIACQCNRDGVNTWTVDGRDMPYSLIAACVFLADIGEFPNKIKQRSFYGERTSEGWKWTF